MAYQVKVLAMIRVLLLSSMLLLSACSGISGAAVKTVAVAALGVDGGPSLSADVQAGKSNARATVGDSKVTDIKVAPVLRDNAFETLNQDNRTTSGDKDIGAENVGVINNNHVPTWLILLFAAFVPAIWQWPRLIMAALNRARTQPTQAHF